MAGLLFFPPGLSFVADTFLLSPACFFDRLVFKGSGQLSVSFQMSPFPPPKKSSVLAFAFCRPFLPLSIAHGIRTLELSSFLSL